MGPQPSMPNLIQRLLLSIWRGPLSAEIQSYEDFPLSIGTGLIFLVKSDPFDRFMSFYRLFVIPGQPEHSGFVEVVGKDLQSYRQPLRRLAAGHAHARNTAQIARNGVNIRQIHLHGIVDFFTDLKGREGRYRRYVSVHFSKSLGKILRIERADFLGF